MLDPRLHPDAAKDAAHILSTVCCREAHVTALTAAGGLAALLARVQRPVQSPALAWDSSLGYDHVLSAVFAARALGEAARHSATARADIAERDAEAAISALFPLASESSPVDVLIALSYVQGLNLCDACVQSATNLVTGTLGQPFGVPAKRCAPEHATATMAAKCRGRPVRSCVGGISGAAASTPGKALCCGLKLKRTVVAALIADGASRTAAAPPLRTPAVAEAADRCSGSAASFSGAAGTASSTSGGSAGSGAAAAAAGAVSGTAGGRASSGGSAAGSGSARQRGAGNGATGGGRSTSSISSGNGGSDDVVSMMERLRAAALSHGFSDVQVGRIPADFDFAAWDGVESPGSVYTSAESSGAVAMSVIRSGSAPSRASGAGAAASGGAGLATLLNAPTGSVAAPPLSLAASCAVCGKRAGDPGVDKLRTCARCHAAWYCCANCQRADWKAGHKRECAGAAA